MTEFIQQFINGLSLGSIYALIALGYTMIYGILRFINFAHGDVFMIGAFSFIFVPHWLNILFFLIVVTIHHKIILGEEQFLKERFGQQWIDYTKKARRYI